jgi:hypothetical protein
MGFLEIFEKISSAVEAALEKSVPARLYRRLSEDFKSSLKTKIGQFAGGMTGGNAYWGMSFPRGVSIAKFLKELKEELKNRKVKFQEKEGFLKFEKTQLSISGKKLKIGKLVGKVEGTAKPPMRQIAFVRLTEHAAKRYLRQAYEAIHGRPESGRGKARLAAFQKKYVKQVMAASDGIKAGLRAAGYDKQAVRGLEGPIETFLGGYCDHLLAKHQKTGGNPKSTLPLDLGSSADVRKFKKGFEAEVKDALGKPTPVYLTVGPSKTRSRRVVVSTPLKKVQKLKYAEKELARRM